MTLVNSKRLKESNAEISHYLGVVVDNKDPEFRGRAKIKVFGVFDDIPDADLPWAYQRFEMSFGLGGGSGRMSVPKLGSVVHVQFNNGNYYSPEYKAVQELSPDLIDEISKSYEGAHSVIYDGQEELKIYYTPEKGLNINLKGSKIIIRNDNSILIEHSNSETSVEILGNTVNIKAQNCNIDSPNIRLGENAIESVIKGETFKLIYDSHTHPLPGSPPLVPLPPAVLSQNTKTR